MTDGVITRPSPFLFATSDPARSLEHQEVEQLTSSLHRRTTGYLQRTDHLPRDEVGNDRPE